MLPNTIQSEKNQEKVKAIIAQKYNQQEKSLNLNECIEYWKDVLNSRDWSALHYLYLDNCQIDDFGAEFLSRLPWPHLQILLVMINGITAVGINHLLVDVGKPKMSQLKDLFLSCNNIGNQGAKLLIKAELPLLQNLWLFKCQFGDQGVKNLGKGNWPNLTEILLDQNNINFDGYSTIPISNWKELQSITICCPSDKTSEVSTLYLMSVNWSIFCKVDFYFGSSIKQSITVILQSRFSQK